MLVSSRSFMLRSFQILLPFCRFRSAEDRSGLGRSCRAVCLPGGLFLDDIQTADIRKAAGLDIQLVIAGQCAVDAGVQPIHQHQFLGGIDDLLGGVHLVVLRVHLRGEDGQQAAVQLGFHQAQQLKGAAGQVVTVVDAHRAALHAPPVVDGLAGVGVVPAAIEDGADDLDIKDIPAPLRQAHRMDGAVGEPLAEAVVPEGVGRLAGVPGVKEGDIVPVREIDGVGRVGQAGPPQQDPALGPHRAQALGGGGAKALLLSRKVASIESLLSIFRSGYDPSIGHFLFYRLFHPQIYGPHPLGLLLLLLQ